MNEITEGKISDLTPDDQKGVKLGTTKRRQLTTDEVLYEYLMTRCILVLREMWSEMQRQNER